MKTLLAVLVALPMAASASEGASEFWYQAGAGQQDVTLELSQKDQEVEYTGGSSEKSLMSFYAEYEYGYDEHRAIGIKLGYGTGDYDDGGTNKGDIAGLKDIELLYKAYSPRGSGNLRYGASVDMAFGDEEKDSSKDKNLQSGGIEIEPYIGWEQSKESCTWGARLAQEIELTARKYDDKSGTPTTGEKEGALDTTLSFFYEHKYNEEKLAGVALHYVTISDEDTKVDGGATTTDEEISPIVQLDLYGRFHAGNGELIPSLKYQMTTADKVNNVDLDSYSQTELGVKYRMVF